jgi:hypothetical protein
MGYGYWPAENGYIGGLVRPANRPNSTQLTATAYSDPKSKMDSLISSVTKEERTKRQMKKEI